MGWNVMPTAKYARGIDLLVYNSTGRQHLGIQVKALSRRKPPVPLGKSIDELMGDWWIIVTNVGNARARLLHNEAGGSQAPRPPW